tara:strand:+ start:1968 stop:4838 length:2871 start_codon:yes stop_codon:yes gene_type:complete
MSVVSAARASGDELASFDVAWVRKKSQDGFLIFPSIGKSWYGDGGDGAGDAPASSVLAMYCVFDGHKDATAMLFLETHLGKNVEHELRLLSAETRSKGGREEDESALEQAIRRALVRTEGEYGRSNMKGCFFCHGRAPEGGSTVVVVALQCAAAGRDGHSFAIDLVCANVGDSGALMLPHPSELEGMTPEDREQHVRLNREHNPDDPFEARRLISAECRLARLRTREGDEVGPLRVFPGGYAVSRAFGDFDLSAIVCEPEFTRVRMPEKGCRLLVASDGVFSALTDNSIASECSQFMDTETCADGIVQKVLKVRGVHDDITAVVVDLPPIAEIRDYVRASRPSAGPIRRLTGFSKAPEPLSREQEMEIQEAESVDVTVHQGRNFGDFSAKKIYDEFDVQELIGRGIYGSVRRAKDRLTGDVVAVKSILRSRMVASAIADECDVLQVLCGHHPNFPAKFMIYEDHPKLKSEVTHIVTDLYSGGTMIQAISSRGLFDEGDWCVFANQLLGAVSFMHSLGVAHRDLKPDNIMLKEPWSPTPGSIPTLKIIDFGSATFCLSNETMRGHVGTKFFSAPECLRRKPYTKKCDVWSVGVLLMVLLKGFPSGLEVEEQWRSLQRGEEPSFPSSIPKHFIKLIKAALVMDPARRPSCGSILKAADEWLGTSFTHNRVFTSPKKSRPARPLSLPKDFKAAYDLHVENVKATSVVRDQQEDHEEEDISVYKGNSWQLDLRLEKGVVRSPSGRALDVVESLSAHNNVLVYQRHVTDMLSVVATPIEVRDVMKNINSKLEGRYQSTKRTSIDAEGNEHTWCPALLLEEAAEDTGAVDVLAQLKLARYLTGLPPEELLIDMNTLSNLDTLHERHRHVFDAFSEHSPSSSKLNAAELSAMDGERRVVQSEAHSDMVRAMIARGLSSYDLTSYAKEPAEPSELTVRGGSAWFFEDWSNSSGPKLGRLKPDNP